MTDEEGWSGDVRFLRRLVLAILVIGIAWLMWDLRFVLVLVFGSVLLAVILRAGVRPLHEKLGLSEGAALTVVVVGTLAFLIGAGFLFGSQVASQAGEIREALPAALAQARDFAAGLGLGGWIEQGVKSFSSGSTGGVNLGGLLMSVGDGITNFIILVVGAIFLAANPRLYRTGLIKLVPPSGRSHAAGVLDDCETALRLWFKGRVLAMVMVGALTTLGLWLIGVPSYLALGLLAALLEFIPFFGPLIAAVPGVLLALLESPTHAMLAAGLYLLLQQLEGNLITPIIQQHAVELPPALLLFSLLAFGLLFGIVGIILAEPLTVAFFVMVKKLYVREALGTPTPIPGEDA